MAAMLGSIGPPKNRIPGTTISTPSVKVVAEAALRDRRKITDESNPMFASRNMYAAIAQNVHHTWCSNKPPMVTDKTANGNCTESIKKTVMMRLVDFPNKIDNPLIPAIRSNGSVSSSFSSVMAVEKIETPASVKKNKLRCVMDLKKKSPGALARDA